MSKGRRSLRCCRCGLIISFVSALLIVLHDASNSLMTWVSFSRNRVASCCRKARSIPSATLRHAEMEPLSRVPSLDLIRKQSNSGFALARLGVKLRDLTFDASALDGKVHVVFDGLQRLQHVKIAKEISESLDAIGSQEELAALLDALQRAYDSSYLASQGDVQNLYRQNANLLASPLSQIGAGNTGEDPWEIVYANEHTNQMANDLFFEFDEDGDGYWNLHETSQVQLATEGVTMSEDAFNSLLIAASPNHGRDLTEEDLQLGLSREQVVRLYTDAALQRSIGVLLDVSMDHAKVFKN